ncbi:acyl-CoA synthetase (AMP-forming)/AMP-acid ligase II [Neorhizobium huautlense]|uniref:Acyl-CoA synthetase (AMP-forming)/AMP-acid ligase II n=1 Tax=Neorhizobium huautlense TaxID=67774 RepID=A0ABT9Q3S6_9HYPH|nr:AMP-binding protein [Neorhizobium huautlense]MDP9840624.1 acyl-CoA synthetase (AMP-forming)/AMP-acid ligase II [Neorhizobium huautlense]
MSLLDRIIPGDDNRDPLWRFPAEGLELRLSDLLARAGRIAAGLIRRNVARDDRVILLMDTGSAAVAALLAVWWVGAVAVPLRPHGADDGEPDGLVCDVARICNARIILHTAHLGFPSGGTIFHTDVEALASGCEPAPAFAETCLSDVALVQFTSGSTGQPKGVRVRHDMIVAQLQQLRHNYALGAVGIRPRSVGSWLPIYHDMGLFIGMLLPLFTQSDVVLAPPSYFIRNPARWYRLLSEVRCDLTFSTNSVLAATLKATRHLAPGSCDLSRLVMYLAAEKISAVVLDWLDAALGPLGLSHSNVRTGYGLAEYALGCTSSGNGPVRRQRVRISGSNVFPLQGSPEGLDLVSVGHRNERCNLNVRDSSGRLLPDWHMGEITVAGPCLTDGYENNPIATQAALGRGYMRTGDLGFLADGELYIYGRLDDSFSVGGRQIVPADVELDIEELHFIGAGRSVLFSVDDADAAFSRQILLIESAREWSLAQRTDRISKIRQLTLNKYGFTPTDILLVPRGMVEKTSSGKKRTRVIRQRWVEGKIPQLL